MQKIVILLVFFSTMVFSCSKKEENAPIFGKWKLIERLADPGDGSGVFEAVNSERTLEFLSNGTVVSNGDICSLTLETGEGSEAEYDAETKKIINTNCQADREITYGLEGEYLTVSLLCIEPCALKYRKVN